MTSTPFSELAKLCRALEATTKRKEKTKLLAEFLKSLNQEEVAPAVLLVVGSIFPEFGSRTLELGWKTMIRVLDSGRQTTLVDRPLSIFQIHDTLTRIAEVKGAGSRRAKSSLLQGLISQASPAEVEILVRIIFGEMRIGVSEGMMLEGLAEAAGVEANLIRRALMLTGDIGKVAEIALKRGEIGLTDIQMKLFTPLKPMLATISYNIEEAIEAHDRKTSFEYKLDGARIQIHRSNEKIGIFSRRLSEVTESLPDIVKLVIEKVDSKDAILEGEVVAIKSGKPLPFQDLMRRFRRVHDVDEMIEIIPLRLYLFDILYLDGELMIDEPYSKRRVILEEIAPKELLVPKLVTEEDSEAEKFLKRAIESGHEGLMAKRLDSPYTPGKRGKLWFKIKQAETLDLVIAAADWGYGRRTGWLSNYHLAAQAGNGFQVIGKTFKGLTDDEFKWMTERLQNLKVRETPTTVHVLPELVVEVAYNEIQRSPHYESGFALRFARIARIREDKKNTEADTINRVQDLYQNQFKYKGRLNV
ncbi:MAG: ATP-dependent DNA ligase [Candidatus Hermodarchaeia archaeon]|jgi:DNA ligase-1